MVDRRWRGITEHPLQRRLDDARDWFRDIRESIPLANTHKFDDKFSQQLLLRLYKLWNEYKRHEIESTRFAKNFDEILRAMGEKQHSAKGIQKWAEQEIRDQTHVDAEPITVSPLLGLEKLKHLMGQSQISEWPSQHEQQQSPTYSSFPSLPAPFPSLHRVFQS